MNGKQPDLIMLARLQSALWYIFVILFGTITAIHMFDAVLAQKVAYWSILGIVAATLLRVIALSEIFRRSHHPKYCLLSYLLFVVLLSSAIVRFI